MMYSKNISPLIQPVSDLPKHHSWGILFTTAFGGLMYGKTTQGGHISPFALNVNNTVMFSFSLLGFIWYKFLYPLGPKIFPVFGQRAKPLSSPLKILFGSLKISFWCMVSKYSSSSLNHNLIDYSVTWALALLMPSAFLSEISLFLAKNFSNHF